MTRHSRSHVCVIGSGLAGACAALSLAAHAQVTLLEAHAPATGASGAAAGLVNPFMGQKARQLSEHSSRLHALEVMLRLAGVTSPAPGLWRPASDSAQAALFAQRATEHPLALVWHDAEAAERIWPALRAPHGALLVREGRAVDVAALVRALVACACDKGVAMRAGADGDVAGIESIPAGLRLHVKSGDALDADIAVVCTGGVPFPLTQNVPLHRVKGQLARFWAPDVAPRLPLVAGHGYLVPEGDTVLVGSTFEHHFTHLAPTSEGVDTLREMATTLVPALKDAPLLEARAGVRVTVPGREPVVGPLPGAERVWIFNGLGARGLLTAPWLAEQLWRFLQHPDTVPLALRRTLT